MPLDFEHDFGSSDASPRPWFWALGAYMPLASRQSVRSPATALSPQSLAHPSSIGRGLAPRSDRLLTILETPHYPGRDSFSRPRSACLRSNPQRYPESEPSLRITRWQGMAMATGLAAQAWATALADPGAPIRLAISE